MSNTETIKKMERKLSKMTAEMTLKEIEKMESVLAKMKQGLDPRLAKEAKAEKPKDPVQVWFDGDRMFIKIFVPFQKRRAFAINMKNAAIHKDVPTHNWDPEKEQWSVHRECNLKVRAVLQSFFGGHDIVNEKGNKIGVLPPSTFVKS